MPKGYWIAHVDVTDPEGYKEYVALNAKAFSKYGARFLIATDSPEVLEGDRTVKRIVFIEFESPRRAREFYHSKDYQDVIDYRFKSAKAHLYILDGLEQPQ